MGKTRIAIAVLLCICLLSFTAATAFLMPVTEDVTVTRNVLYGDPSALEGLNVDFRCQYRATLHWDIHCDPVTAESTTDFIFSHDDPFATPYDGTPRGVEMYPLLDYRSHRFSLNTDLSPSVPADSGIARLIADLNALPLSESETDGTGTVDADEEDSNHTVDLSDYFEYYPFDGLVDISYTGLTPSWEAFSEYSARASESSKMLSELFNSYFKIPVQDNALVKIHIIDWRDGSRDYIFGGFPNDTAYFSPETYSFVSGSSSYFVFDSSHGQDVSQIPGGWGIYRLDYTLAADGDIASAELSTVYPLDPAIRVNGMTLSGDGKTILLRSFDDKGDYLTVIDLATMEKLQELAFTDDAQSVRSEFIIQDDYIICLYNGTQLSVYQRLANGTYEQRIDIDITAAEDVPTPNFYSMYSCDHSGMAFDGQRLVVGDFLFRPLGSPYIGSTRTVCGFTLSVYDSTGLIYHGEYDTSLSPVIPAADAYSIYSEEIYPNYNEPLVLTWE